MRTRRAEPATDTGSALGQGLQGARYEREREQMPNYISVVGGKTALASARRICVIGCSGGGKTTLSMRISKRLGVEYLSLDRDVRWLPGWVVRDRAEQRLIATDFAARENWVFDGSGASSFDIRMPRTDLVIWVRVPRYMALWGLAVRVISNFGTVRVGMADGCPEPFPDREFLSYIWNFDRIHTPKFEAEIDRYAKDVPVVVVRSRTEMRDLLD